MDGIKFEQSSMKSQPLWVTLYEAFFHPKYNIIDLNHKYRRTSNILKGRMLSLFLNDFFYNLK